MTAPKAAKGKRGRQSSKRAGAMLLAHAATHLGEQSPDQAWRGIMREATDRATRALVLSRVLDDPTDPLFFPALKWAAENGYGKPKDQIEHSGSVSYVAEIPAKLTVEEWTARGRVLAKQHSTGNGNGHSG